MPLDLPDTTSLIFYFGPSGPDVDTVSARVVLEGTSTTGSAMTWSVVINAPSNATREQVLDYAFERYIATKSRGSHDTGTFVGAPSAIIASLIAGESDGGDDMPGVTHR